VQPLFLGTVVFLALFLPERFNDGGGAFGLKFGGLG
jgi:hypothetical protein